jgi:hypothetical protein
MVRLFIAVRMLHLSLVKTLTQFVPALISSTVMGVAVWLTLMAGQTWPALLTLLAAVAVGAVVYPAVLWFFERELMLRVFDMIRSRILGDDDEDEESEAVESEV